jgi:hypothetical protein
MFWVAVSAAAMRWARYFGDRGHTSVRGDIGRSTELLCAGTVSIDICAAAGLVMGGTVSAVGVAYFEGYISSGSSFISLYMHRADSHRDLAVTLALGGCPDGLAVAHAAFGLTECQPLRATMPVAPNGRHRLSPTVADLRSNRRLGLAG